MLRLTWENPSATDGETTIEQFLWYMKIKGRRASTITARNSALRALNKRVDIMNPKLVTVYLWAALLTESRKHKLVQDLEAFYKWKRLPFDSPQYRRDRKPPFIPHIDGIVLLIRSVGPKLGAFLQVMKETAVRPGEAWNLKWNAIDFKRRVITVEFPEKGSLARRRKVSERLLLMLNHLPHQWDFVFHKPYDDSQQSLGALEDFRRCFEDQRKRIAAKHPGSDIERISFMTFRHWRATMEYVNTKDPLRVKELLGHVNIQWTLHYIDLAQAYTPQADEYVVMRAQNIDEAQELLEAGFEPTIEMNGVRLFRKMKWLMEDEVY